MMPPFGAAAHQTAELIENVGIVADRLLAACTSGIHPDNVDPRSMLEQALIVAAEAQQQLAAQKERIATLETLSLTDELTALYNRRGFAQEFRRTLALAQRLDSNGVLAYIDLDQFKAVNDGAGHQAGDAVLRHVAEILSSNLRATDMVARVGGDEFAAILVHTSEQSGLRRATALERLLNSTVVHYEDYEIPVSASLGVVPFGANDTTETLIAQADAMMYRAKRAKPRNLYAWRKRTV